jgi:hypothetical protein
MPDNIFSVSEGMRDELTGQGASSQEIAAINSEADLDKLKEELKNRNQKNDETSSNSDEEKKTEREGEGTKETPTAENSDEEQKKEEKAPLEVGIGAVQADENQNAEVPDWIKKKNEYYQGLANNQQIENYSWDHSKEGFCAGFNNATVHYASPDNVTVSPGAGYKVFDAMLSEPDNKGRPVNLPEGASKEDATNLFAACIMNGNKPMGAIPQELDEATLAKSGLSQKDIETVKAEFAKLHPDNTNANTNTNTNQDNNRDIVLNYQEKMDGKQCWEAACKLGIGYDMVLARENGAPIQMQRPEELTGEAREKFLNSLSPENLLEVVRLAKTSHEQIDPKKLRDVAVIAVTKGRDMMNRCDAEFKRMLDNGEIKYTGEKDKHGNDDIKVGSNRNGGGSLDDAIYIRERSRELKESIKGVIKTVEPINNDTSRKSAKELNDLRLKTLRDKLDEFKATKEYQDKQDTRDLIMAKRLGLTNAVVYSTSNGKDKKEVQKYDGQKLEDYKKTLKPETLARLQQKFGKQNG